MANQILVPLDGSALAEQALSCAVTLGQGLSAGLVLFRAVSIPPEVQEALDRAGLNPGPLLERLETEACQYLEAMRHLLRNTGLGFSHVVRRGLAAEAIVDYVEKTDIRLIVMATHGYIGLKRWTHGSVAERVLQAASVPVLLVRAREADPARGLQQPLPCWHILVPLDGSELAEQVLPIVSPIARALEAEMTLLQVATTHVLGPFSDEWYPSLQSTFEIVEQQAKLYLESMACHLNEQGIETSTVVWTGLVADSIVRYAEVNHMDLIARCTHGRTGLARWALGSVADRVLRAAEIPILLVRAG